MREQSVILIMLLKEIIKYHKPILTAPMPIQSSTNTIKLAMICVKRLSLGMIRLLTISGASVIEVERFEEEKD